MIGCRLCPYLSAKPVDDALHGGESDAGPFKFLAAVHSLEGAEQFARVGHVETRAVVADKVSLSVTMIRNAELDSCLLAPSP